MKQQEFSLARQPTKLEVLLRRVSAAYAGDPTAPGVVTSLVGGRFYAAVLRYCLPGGAGRITVAHEEDVDVGVAVRRLAERWARERGSAPSEPDPAPVRRANSDEERQAVDGLHLLISWDQDRATVRNGIGFSRNDTVVGRELAERAEAVGLDDQQWAHVVRLAHKYRRQIGEIRTRLDERLREARLDVLRWIVRQIEQTRSDSGAPNYVTLSTLRQMLQRADDGAAVESAVMEAIYAAAAEGESTAVASTSSTSGAPASPALAERLRRALVEVEAGLSDYDATRPLRPDREYTRPTGEPKLDAALAEIGDVAAALDSPIEKGLH